MFTLVFSSYFFVAFVLLARLVWENRAVLLFPETRKETALYCLVAAFGFPTAWKGILAAVRENGIQLRQEFKSK